MLYGTIFKEKKIVITHIFLIFLVWNFRKLFKPNLGFFLELHTEIQFPTVPYLMFIHSSIQVSTPRTMMMPDGKCSTLER